MRNAALLTFVVTGLIVASGCSAVSAPGSPNPDGAATVSSLPAPSACLTDSAPRPGSVDGVGPSEYPEPPIEVSREAVVDWTQDFERAYFRNSLLAAESSTDDHNLTEASAFAEIRRVERGSQGYRIWVSDSGARNYESGLHGDQWATVGYFVNETHVIRVPVDSEETPIDTSDGTVVLQCPG